MPKSVQARAKALIHEMYLSPTRKAALTAYDQFITAYQAKYPKATDCLEKELPQSHAGTERDPSLPTPRFKMGFTEPLHPTAVN